MRRHSCGEKLNCMYIGRSTLEDVFSLFTSSSIVSGAACGQFKSSTDSVRRRQRNDLSVARACSSLLCLSGSCVLAPSSALTVEPSRFQAPNTHAEVSGGNRLKVSLGRGFAPWRAAAACAASFAEVSPAFRGQCMWPPSPSGPQSNAAGIGPARPAKSHALGRLNNWLRAAPPGAVIPKKFTPEKHNRMFSQCGPTSGFDDWPAAASPSLTHSMNSSSLLDSASLLVHIPGWLVSAALCWLPSPLLDFASLLAVSAKKAEVLCHFSRGSLQCCSMDTERASATIAVTSTEFEFRGTTRQSREITMLAIDGPAVAGAAGVSASVASPTSDSSLVSEDASALMNHEHSSKKHPT